MKKTMFDAEHLTKLAKEGSRTVPGFNMSFQEGPGGGLGASWDGFVTKLGGHTFPGPPAVSERVRGTIGTEVGGVVPVRGLRRLAIE